MKFISDKEANNQLGIFLVVMLFFKSFFENFLFNHQLDLLSITGIRIRTSLINLVYKKSLLLSPLARRGATVGEIVNLMQVNTQVFYDLMSNISLVVSIPFQLFLSILLLWLFLGKSAIASMCTASLIIPFIFFVSVFLEKTEQNKLILKDNRLKLTNELLNGMKVIKFYGWEVSFLNLISKIRIKELNLLKRFARLSGVLSFSWTSTSFLIQVVTLSTYIFIDNGKNILDPSTAFVSLTLFNMIRMPLYTSATLASNLIQVKLFNFINK